MPFLGDLTKVDSDAAGMFSLSSGSNSALLFGLDEILCFFTAGSTCQNNTVLFTHACLSQTLSIFNTSYC